MANPFIGEDLRLSEALFQLTMAFWTFLDRSGDMTASVLVHFTAVRGIHRQSLAYKSAYNYTPDLSKLIWIGRLLFLEYALPLKTYKTLAYPWPLRDRYPDQAGRLEEIRTKYLLRGAFSPMSEIIELRAFGRSIVKKEGGRTNLTWAADGQSFTIGSSSQVVIRDFTYMHHTAVVKVEERIGQLMLGWDPIINLGSICDDFNCAIPGWSFLEEEHNGLRFAYKALSRRAWSSGYLGQPFAKHGHWLPEACNVYIQSETELKNEIFAAIHFTAGLPARGTEITSIRIHNTAEVMRNLIFREGRLLLVIGYNKARASNHHAFYIVRYLPPRLARSVFLYLVYIRPFIDFLAAQLRFPHLRATEYLFPDPRNKQKHFSTSQATDVLKYLTQRFPTPMSLSLYRQSALAIAKRYIKELIQQTDFYKPRASTDPMRIIAAGVGHHPRMLLTEYAIDNALPARLQPELLEMYLRLSNLWQDWNAKYYNDHRSLSISSTLSALPIVENQGTKRKLPLDILLSERLNKRKPSQMLGIAHSDDGNGFRYDEQYKIIICISCESALQPSPKSWYQHLSSMHRILGSESKALIQRFHAYDVSPLSELVIPEQQVVAIEGLRIFNGFRCRVCLPSSTTFITTHERKMKDHISSAHQLKPLQAKRARKYTSCFLQTFSLAPGLIRYFEVIKS